MTIEQHLCELTDPRVDRTKMHKLIAILVIALCAIITGANNWEDKAEFRWAKIDWFQTFLELPKGIPSHNTFNQLSAWLKPQEFSTRFMSWIRAMSKGLVVK